MGFSKDVVTIVKKHKWESFCLHPGDANTIISPRKPAHSSMSMDVEKIESQHINIDYGTGERVIATTSATSPVVLVASDAPTQSKKIEAVLEDIKDTKGEEANPLTQLHKRKKMATKHALAMRRITHSSQPTNSLVESFAP
ncbi:hypothetical protein V6N13_072492 [Hibiscus sabdariffa]